MDYYIDETQQSSSQSSDTEQLSQQTARFRLNQSETEVFRKKQWHCAFNFAVDIKRMVTGGPDKGGPIIQLKTPLYPGEQYEGYLPDIAIHHPLKFLTALKTGFPKIGGFSVMLTQIELAEFWRLKYAEYYTSCTQQYGYSHPTIESSERLGWHDKYFLLSPTIQLDTKGRPVAPERWRHILLTEHTRGVPVPSVAMVDNGSAAVQALFRILKRDLPETAFMAAILVGGAVLSSIHYGHILNKFCQAPVTMLLGEPNTFKTLLSKVATSLVGLHRAAIFSHLTAAKAQELLGRCIMYVVNDPENPELVKTIVTRTFEQGVSSNCLREMEPNCVPIITANHFVMKGLQAHGTRELSRIVVIPLTEASANPTLEGLDRAMDSAGTCIGRLVKLRKEVRRMQPNSVHQLANRYTELLPTDDAVGRIAKSYAISTQLAIIFSDGFELGVTPEDIQRYVENQMLPGVRNHLIPESVDSENAIVGLLESAIQAFGAPEMKEFASVCKHRFKTLSSAVPALALRVRALKLALDKRITVNTVTEVALRRDVTGLGGENGPHKFGAQVKSAAFIPVDALPPHLYEQLSSQKRPMLDEEQIAPPAKKRRRKVTAAKDANKEKSYKPTSVTPSDTSDTPISVTASDESDTPASVTPSDESDTRTSVTSSDESDTPSCVTLNEQSDHPTFVTPIEDSYTPSFVTPNGESETQTFVTPVEGTPSFVTSNKVAESPSPGIPIEVSVTHNKESVSALPSPVKTREPLLITEESVSKRISPSTSTNKDIVSAAAAEIATQLPTVKRTRATEATLIKATLASARRKIAKRGMCSVCDTAKEGDWIYCNVCKLWLHGKCDGLTDSEVKTLGASKKRYKCRRCTA